MASLETGFGEATKTAWHRAKFAFMAFCDQQARGYPVFIVSDNVARNEPSDWLIAPAVLECLFTPVKHINKANIRQN